MPRAEDLGDASTPRKTAPLSMGWLRKLEGAELKGGEKQEHTWGVKSHTAPPPPQKKKKKKKKTKRDTA